MGQGVFIGLDVGVEHSAAIHADFLFTRREEDDIVAFEAQAFVDVEREILLSLHSYGRLGSIVCAEQHGEPFLGLQCERAACIAETADGSGDVVDGRIRKSDHFLGCFLDAEAGTYASREVAAEINPAVKFHALDAFRVVRRVGDDVDQLLVDADGVKHFVEQIDGHLSEFVEELVMGVGEFVGIPVDVGQPDEQLNVLLVGLVGEIGVLVHIVEGQAMTGQFLHARDERTPDASIGHDILEIEGDAAGIVNHFVGGDGVELMLEEGGVESVGHLCVLGIGRETGAEGVEGLQVVGEEAEGLFWLHRVTGWMCCWGRNGQAFGVGESDAERGGSLSGSTWV